MKLARIPSLAQNSLDHLLAYQWPGNIRELENQVERELIISRGNELLFQEIAMNTAKGSNALLHREHYDKTPKPGISMGLDKAMAKHIQQALTIARGKVEGKGGAAELLEINPRTLRNRMNKLGVPFGKDIKKKMQHAIDYIGSK